MGEFIRDNLPDVIGYFELEGVPLKGPSHWKTGPCHFHGGSDSLRVNVKTGGWCCMACGTKGGDVLAYCMQRHGLDFVDAARALGAYIDDDKPHQGPTKKPALSPRDAMQLVAFELTVATIVLADARSGVLSSDSDWQRFLTSANRIIAMAEDYA